MMIDKELISIGQDYNDKLKVIGNLAEQARKNGKINDAKKFVNAVLAREQESSTAVGFLVAIPHGKSEAVQEPFVGFCRPLHPMNWDGEEVQLIFLIGVPTHQKDTLHLKILSHISRKLVDEDFRKSLLQADNKTEVLDCLSAIENKLV